MCPRFDLGVLAAAALVASGTSFADAGIANACPPRLAVNQTIGGNAADGWIGFGSSKEHPFIGVMFSSGSPDKLTILAPSRQAKKNRVKTSTWEFPQSDLAYWVSCQYAGTSVVVAREMDMAISECTVEYDSRFSEPVAKKWECKRLR